MSTIDQFKNALINGGARTNQFRVTGGFPSNLTATLTNLAGSAIGGAVGQAISSIGSAVGNITGSTAGANLQFMCKAASIPASNVGVIPVPYRGKVLKVAGDRTFDPWTITIINDTNFALRKAFEQWSNAIISHKSNIGLNNLNYMQDWKVEQLDRSGGVLQTYNVRDCFPGNISDIQLTYDSTDQIEEFTVTIDYQYWENAETTN